MADIKRAHRRKVFSWNFFVCRVFALWPLFLLFHFCLLSLLDQAIVLLGVNDIHTMHRYVLSNKCRQLDRLFRTKTTRTSSITEQREKCLFASSSDRTVLVCLRWVNNGITCFILEYPWDCPDWRQGLFSSVRQQIIYLSVNQKFKSVSQADWS